MKNAWRVVAVVLVPVFHVIFSYDSLDGLWGEAFGGLK